MNPLETLKKYFGHESFLTPQAEVVDALLSSQNCLVLMPTGGGKSLCYQLPGLVTGQKTLVLSPLIALMKDQVDDLRSRGIQASFINSSVGREDREKRLKQFVEGQISHLYVTPERFRSPEFCEKISKIKVHFLAVDEAHCISQWGHDFRPEYRRIPEILKFLNDPTVVGLTATATETVEKDICKQLQIETRNVFKKSIERKNLSVQVKDVYGFEGKLEELFGLVDSDGAKIIYFSLISQLEAASMVLEKKRIRHAIYHGQMSESPRRASQDAFMKGETNLMLATPAFGLGVNKADVRQVIHFELPGSIEAYFQEIGRAGRDGLASTCTLLYDDDDISTQMEFIKWSNPDVAFIERVFRLIERNPVRVKQEGYDYLRSEMNFYNKRDYRVETAVGLLRSQDILKDWNVIGEFKGEDWDGGARELRLKGQHVKLLDLVKWVKADDCRMLGLYAYFGDATANACGVCDHCQGLDREA